MSAKDKIKKYEEAEKAIGEADSAQEKEQNEVKDGSLDTLDMAQLLQEKLTVAEADSKAKYDQLLRLAAEFDNYKKRMNRENDDFRRYANESLLKELLPVIDNLERAVGAFGDGSDSANCVIEGVKMTLQDLLKAFEKFGVKQIDSVGKPFDPAFHQAILQEGAVGLPENTVIREMLRGYMIYERLLRAAMVVVSKAPEMPMEPKNNGTEFEK